MADKEEAQPRYLMDKDGQVNLYAGKDIDAARATGLVDPVGKKSNGEDWHPNGVEDDIVTPEMAYAKAKEFDAKRQEKIAARKAKEAEDARKASEKSRAEGTADVAARTPDFHVAIVSAPDESKPAKK